jgi:predicted transcriptional regulator
MITHQQPEHIAAAIRGARGVLGWSQTELAVRAGISTPTVARIEIAAIQPKLDTIGRLMGAIEDAGVYINWTAPGVFSINANLSKK